MAAIFREIYNSICSCMKEQGIGQPTMIIPSNGGEFAPINERKDQSQDPYVMTPERRAAVGQIVFSRQMIDEQLTGVHLESSFDLAEVTAGTGIFARFFWPRAIRSYALGKSYVGDKPVFGPIQMNHNQRVQFLVKALIDGKEITCSSDGNDCQSFAQTSFRSELKEPIIGSIDFYAWQTTVRSKIISSDIAAEMEDEWSSSAARWAYHFSQLSPGSHRIELALHFRLLVDGTRGEDFPSKTTPLSLPIATGGFTLVVPHHKVPRRSVLPKRPEGMINAEQDEQLIFAYLSNSVEWGKRAPQKEEVIKIIMTSNWTDGETEWVHGSGKRVVNRARDFLAIIRRRRSTGWTSESVAVFKLTAYGPKSYSYPQNTLTTISDLGVGGQSTRKTINITVQLEEVIFTNRLFSFSLLSAGTYSFDAELLSESDLSLFPGGVGIAGSASSSSGSVYPISVESASSQRNQLSEPLIRSGAGGGYGATESDRV